MAPTSTQVIQSKGIYLGLPTFPPELKNLKAIVAGANGISGQHMLRALSEEPERWSQIYALSRRPPLDTENLGKNIKHLAVDFLSSPEAIAKILREENVQADYVFFFAYLQPTPKPGQSLWTNAEEMCDVNGRLLQNLLTALPLSTITPSRIILQTGLKNYGGHLGPTTTPHIESDPRITLEPNFYYTQEDLLATHCAQHPSTHFTVLRPSFILGAVRDAAMNLLYPLAIYAAVQAHLHQPLVFPGDFAAWDKEVIMSSAMLNSYMAEWAALTPGAAGQAFNVGDAFPFTWGRFWPVLAGWYGVSWVPPDADAKYEVMESAHVPRGFGPKGRIRSTYALPTWASTPTVQAAWAELTSTHSLSAQSPFADAATIDRLFSFVHFALVVPWPWQYSVDKARNLGWCGYVNSHEAMREVVVDLGRLGMVPPLEGVEGGESEGRRGG